MDILKNTELTPKQIVEKLDSYIIGQEKAKKAVAVALRNRFRRLKLSEDIRDEVAPKNILMIGPTGVGKTEIARRLAKLCGAPFLKVEATKYTEVGYVGRDVESMVRDLMAVGYNDVKAEMEDKLREKSVNIVEEKLLDLLLPAKPKVNSQNEKKGTVAPMGFITQNSPSEISIDLNKIAADFEAELNAANEAAAKQQANDESNAENERENHTRERFRQMLREGKLEDREVEMIVHRPQGVPSMEIIAGGSIDDLQNSMQGLMNMINGNGKGKKRSVTIREARKILTEEVLDGMIDHDKVSDEAKKRVEQSGIIFIDEIDKIARKKETTSRDVSGESVQQGMLKLLEGADIEVPVGSNSKNAMVPLATVNTRNILFICGGAFAGLENIVDARVGKKNLGFGADIRQKHEINITSAFQQVQPEDLIKFGLIPEFAGRLPVVVTLDSLDKQALVRILKEPRNALVKQYKRFLEMDGVDLEFEDGALEAIAEEALKRNAGARGLRAIIESIMRNVMYDVPSRDDVTKCIVTEEAVREHADPQMIIEE